jgi:methylated-DNA-[protein]-cysteine S-methyltransferase
MHKPTHFITVETPIGFLLLQASMTHFFSITFGNKEGGKWNTVLELAAHQISDYFRGTLREFEIPYLLEGTTFQKSVWKELAKIPYGETISYKELACRIGNPKAYRAVALANRSNPLPILLLCHRVIKSSGKLGGYFRGCSIKKKLLELEGITSFRKQKAYT